VRRRGDAHGAISGLLKFAVDGGLIYLGGYTGYRFIDSRGITLKNGCDPGAAEEGGKLRAQTAGETVRSAYGHGAVEGLIDINSHSHLRRSEGPIAAGGLNHQLPGRITARGLRKGSLCLGAVQTSKVFAENAHAPIYAPVVRHTVGEGEYHQDAERYGQTHEGESHGPANAYLIRLFLMGALRVSSMSLGGVYCTGTLH
jgi:hypothetical protein